jgi:glucan phosphoethanolaminetransferase (alkaline phosphatase superfamily)
VKQLRHPTMQNWPYRYALACLAARFLLANVQTTYPLVLPELLPPVIAILTIALIGLFIAAYWTANGWRIGRRRMRGA